MSDCSFDTYGTGHFVVKQSAPGNPQRRNCCTTHERLLLAGQRRSDRDAPARLGSILISHRMQLE